MRARPHSRDGSAFGRRRRRELRRLPALLAAPSRGAHARRPLPLSIRRPVFGLLGRVYPKADWAPRVFRAKTTFEALARNSVEAYFHGVSILRETMRRPALRQRSQRGPRRLLRDRRFSIGMRRVRTARTRWRLIQYLDLKTYLVGDINTKVDRASMAHSLEVREPLMDHPLIEWLATLSTSVKVRGREGKYLFKKAMEPFLPGGGAVSAEDGLCGARWRRWFRGPLRERVRETLLGERLAGTGWFNMHTSVNWSISTSRASAISADRSGRS